MTQAQKIAKEKFKKAIAYRKKTGASLKEAFAFVYGRKVSPVKKKAALKKKDSPKKKATSKKVAAIKIIEKGETKSTKAKATYQQVRTKKGTYKGLKKVGNINVISGLKKIVGIPHKAKYYISYTTENGIKKVEYFEKLPIGRYKGMDRVIYLTRLTNSGTSLIPVKLTSTDKELKK